MSRPLIALLFALVTGLPGALANPPDTGHNSGLPVETVGGASLPGVPRSVGKAATQAAVKARASSESAKEALTATPADQSPVVLTIQPGTTELVRIARGFLNQIVTPFEDPKLLTVHAVEVEKQGASLYLATSSEGPVGVHIMPNDPDDTRSISLTLIPARIPPRTITLVWPHRQGEGVSPVSRAKARRWEESAPYEERLLEMVQRVARGEVPDGYALSRPTEPVPCELPGMQYFTGQRLTGNHFSVFVVRATNVGEVGIELLRHAGCNFRGVVLVAPWPTAYLEPNVATELFVVVVNDVHEPRATEQLRPSLLEMRNVAHDEQ